VHNVKLQSSFEKLCL